MEGQISGYVDLVAARRAATKRAQPDETTVAKLKKRIIATPALRYRVRLLLTRALEPFSRRRAQKLVGDQPLRLNLGSSLDRKPAFRNVDLAGIPVDLPWNIVRPLPFPTDSVDAICHDHTLEHLTIADGLALTQECFRVLRPGGRMRVSVPDAGGAVDEYRAGKIKEAPTPLLELQRLFYDWGHRTMYDRQTLSALLAECGFTEIERCAFRESQIRPCPDVSFRADSLYIEAVKPQRVTHPGLTID